MTATNAAKKTAMTVKPELNGAPQLVSLRSVPERDDDRTDLFEIDGKPYSIATRPRVNTALRYMHVTRTQGTEAGIDYMLGVLLGDEAYEALMAFDDLTEEQLEQVITIASKIMQGAVEAPKGKQKNG